MIHVPPGLRIILGTLLKAAGKPVARDIIYERLGSDSGNPTNIVNVYISNLRKAIPNGHRHIATDYKRGWRWVA